MQRSDHHYDVLVAGAGPAGSTAARHCARAGLRTLLLDKAEFPRTKPCGGGIPALIENLEGLDLPFPELAPHKVSEQLLRLRGERELRVPLARPIYMVDRATFDTELLRLAQEAGAVFSPNTKVSTIIEENDQVILRTDKGDFSGDYLIGADGASGTTTRHLGNQQERPPAAAIDLEVQVSSALRKVWEERCLFDFGVIPGGYGWVFPKADHLSCGIGAWRGARGLKAALYRFVSDTLQGEFTVLAERAHRIPLFEQGTVVAQGRILAIGDAANLVEPILGEGIRFAIWSAQLAAKALQDSYPAHRYRQDLDNAYADEFRMLRGLAHRDFVEAPDFFYRAFFEKGRDYRPAYYALAARNAARSTPLSAVDKGDNAPS